MCSLLKGDLSMFSFPLLFGILLLFVFISSVGSVYNSKCSPPAPLSGVDGEVPVHTHSDDCLNGHFKSSQPQTSLKGFIVYLVSF